MKTKKIEIRVTEEQKQKIKKLADSEQKTISKFVIDKLFNTETKKKADTKKHYGF